MKRSDKYIAYAVGAMLTWAAALVWVLHDEGVIQWGGTDFKLQPRMK